MAYTSNISKEEQKRLAQEKVDKSFARIHSGVVSVFSNDALPAFLEFTAKFHYFDSNNLILIYKQRPSATFIAPFKTWERIGLNHWHDPLRPVFLSSQKGQGIGILAPYILKKKISDSADLRTATTRTRVVSYLDYHVVFVFDREQTNGIPAPVVEWNLSRDKFDAEAAFNALKAIAPFNIVFSTDSNFKGNYVFEKGENRFGHVDTLVLNAQHRSNYFALCNFTVKTFVTASLKKLEDRLSRDDFEKVSECVSFVVASYFGLSLDAYFFFFVNTWANDSTKMLEILDYIRQAAHSLIERIEAEMIEYKALHGHNEDIYAVDDEVSEFDSLFVF